MTPITTTTDYIQPLTDEGLRAAEWLTGPEAFGAPVAYRAQPCLVFHGVPVWIMPNGNCRVGRPDATLISPSEVPRAVGMLRGDR